MLALEKLSTSNLVESAVEELPALTGQTELLHVVGDELVLRQSARRVLKKEGLVPARGSATHGGPRKALGPTIPRFASYRLRLVSE